MMKFPLKISLLIAFVLLFVAIQYFINSTNYYAHAETQNSGSRGVKNDSGTLYTFGKEDWTNEAQSILSVSMETNKSSSSESLKVEIRPATSMKQSINSSWSIISTDFIPVNFSADYSVDMSISAIDVNQLHSKVIYYDMNRKEIGWNFIFGGRDGTFRNEYSFYILPQIETKYVKIQMWVKQTLDKYSSFTIENVTLDGKMPQLVTSRLNNSSQLIVERIFAGLNSTNGEAIAGPNFAFLGTNDLLMLEADSGKVMRIKNESMQKTPLVDLPVYLPDGLVGIAVEKSMHNATFVYLYLNEAPLKYGNDVNSNDKAIELNSTLGYDREGDRLYRFQLIGNKLVNPKILFSIPDKTTNIVQEIHHGGEVVMGPDNSVYVGIGDIDGYENVDSRTKAQNYINGTEPDGRAGILRIGHDGQHVSKGLLGDKYPLNLYYAYGIRNIFGMDFDPVTGNLWDTENGPNYGDEINLVKPGFNSGWSKIQGFWKPNGEEKGILDLSPSNMVDFNKAGIYSGPEFTWINTVGPTAIKFFSSDKFGSEYKNDLFVSDFNNGNIYHFDLNKNRTALLLHGYLEDKIADSPEELDDVIFAKGFNGVVDMQVGPDGFLYVLSNGSIYKIHPVQIDHLEGK